MLKPAIISPVFLKQIFEDSDSKDKFKNFYIKEIAPYQNQILFLLDDKENTIKKEYNKIIDEANDGAPVQTFIKHYLLSILHENYPDNFDITQLDDHVKKFKFKVIFIKNKKDIEKPLNLKKLKQDHDFPLSLDKFKEIFSDFSRFAKKIQIIDPYIAVHLTNLDSGRRDKKYFNKYGISNIDDIIFAIRSDKNFNPNFSLKMKKNNDYKISLKEIINLIVGSNIDPSNLNIEIISTLQNEYGEGIIDSIDRLKKLIINEKNETIKQKFEELLNQIKTTFYTKSINKTLSGLIKWNVDFKLKALRQEEDGQVSKMYRRSIHMESPKKENGKQIKASMECSPGFNFFSFKKKSLKKEDHYVIRLIFDDEKHRKKLQQPAYFHDFEMKRPKEDRKTQL